MATIPVDELKIIRQFGPHQNFMRGERLSTSTEPEKLVKTHCCFCGQQCGIQLKVKDNVVIGFEPWEEFPFNRGMLCPKGVKRYLQGAHPDRLLTAMRRDASANAGFSAMPYGEAIATVAGEIRRLQSAYGNASIGVLGGASLTTEKTYLLGKFARVCLKTPYIDYNGRLCMVSAGAANKKAFGIDRTTNPWSDMIGTEVIWVAGSNVAEYRQPVDDVSEEYPVFLTTGRVVSQFLSGTQTRRIGPLVQQYPEPRIEMHPRLAEKLGIRDGEWTTAETRRGTITLRAMVVTTIRPDTVFIPYHWAGKKSANQLTVAAQDPISKIPQYKVCGCRVRKAEHAPEYEGKLEPQQ